MDLLERAKTLLQATCDLLQKQDDSHYVLNLLAETVYYDDAECDGSCLKDDIDFWFDELEQTKQKIVSLDKVKQAREEIQKCVDILSDDTVADVNMKSGLGIALEKIDRLIESEG